MTGDGVVEVSIHIAAEPELDSVGNLGIWLTVVTPGASLAGT
jgi:hypothetical protein